MKIFGGGKVGFSVIGTYRDGKPVYVSGLRGSVERDVACYYLAILAYLDTLRIPANLIKRLSVLYGNIINNTRVVGGGICAFAVERSFPLYFPISDQCGYNLGQIKPTINTVFSQAVNYEESIAVRSEIKCPDYRC